MPWSKQFGIIYLIFFSIYFLSYAYSGFCLRVREVVARVDLLMTEEGRLIFFIDSLLPYYYLVLIIFSYDGTLFMLSDYSKALRSLFDNINFLLCSLRLMPEEGAMSSCSFMELIRFVEYVSNVYC